MTRWTPRLRGSHTVQERPCDVNPGWYDDPESALHLRYWNGAEWTDDRRPKPPTAAPAAAVATDGRSDKSFVAALLLALFLGVFGAHRFYVGKVGTGILHLLTLGAFGIWTLIDTVLIILGKFTDSGGRLVKA